MTRGQFAMSVLFALSLGGGLHAQADECAEPECIPTPPCESAADCSEGMRCLDYRNIDCTGVDLACKNGESDEECAERTQMLRESECTMRDGALCLPAWSVACEDDADCPDEFACTGDPGSPCEPQDRTCNADADCPGAWLCRTYDAGFCAGGDGCVGNQRRETACVPPALGGNSVLQSSNDDDAIGDDATSDASIGSVEPATSAKADGCRVSGPVGARASGVAVLGLFTLAACSLARRTRRSAVARALGHGGRHPERGA